MCDFEMPSVLKGNMDKVVVFGKMILCAILDIVRHYLGFSIIVLL